MIKMVTRDQWGAMPGTGMPRRGPPSLLVVHHSYRPTVQQWKGNQSMASIQRYHMVDQGWSDIGYHYVIAPDGIIYEGRPANLIGAHCGGHPPRNVDARFGNSNTIGVCVIGDYNDTQPDPQVVLVLGDLLNKLSAEWGLDPRECIRGHFEAWSRPPKTCPGQHLAEAIGRGAQWRAAFPKGG